MASSASENRLVLSKIATNGKHGENSPYFDGWKVYDQNPYHLTENPEGVIQMGFAETQLPFDLVEEWIKKYPKALFALLKELRSSETWPIFKTTMSSQSSDRPLLRSCRKHEVVESYLILTEAKPPEQTSWSCSV